LASFFTVGSLALAMLVSYWFHIRIPNYWVIARILLFIPLVMLFLAFRRYEDYLFIDVDNQVLTRVRVNPKEKQSLLEAIELIKQKTQVTNESYFDDSLPNMAPIFQFTEYDFADFLNKSTVRVYEDKIIDVEKSLVEEVTTITMFDELSGETKFAKMANDKWDYVWSYWMYFVFITGISAAILFAEHMKGNYLFGYLFFGGLALLIPLYLFRYIKSEILFFIDKRDNVAFLTPVNSTNREKLNQIVDFIKGKVISQT